MDFQSTPLSGSDAFSNALRDCIVHLSFLPLGSQQGPSQPSDGYKAETVILKHITT